MQSNQSLHFTDTNIKSQIIMPFSPNKLVLAVLPKPENATGVCLTENIPLSAIEDKELRKKLRNRQSALAARERKKARMLELEKQVAELQDTNRRTEEENQYLRSRLEIALRKCVRAGIPLDNEHDLMWIRSSNISLLKSRAVSRNRVLRVPSAQPMKHPSLISPKECTEKIQVATSHEIKARGQTEASLKSAIKALGERQSEILQSLSTGVPVNVTVEKSRENRLYYTQSRSPMTKIVNTPPFIQCKQEIAENLEHNPSTTPFLQPNNSAFCNSAFPVNSRKRQPEPEYDESIPYNQQALPSIGAMLGSSAKKARQNSKHHSPCRRKMHWDEHKSISLPVSPSGINSFPALENTGFLSNANSPFKTENSFRPEPVLSVSDQKQEAVPGAISLESCDYNLNLTSPPSLMPNTDGLLDLEEIINCYDNKQSDNNVVNIDWQDVMLSSNIVDSPPGRSDSGISMDDSLDWITDNPVFDL